MSNTLQWLPQIEKGRVEEVFGDVRVAVVHEATSVRWRRGS